SHHAVSVSTDIPHADVVAEDDENVRALPRGRGCPLLRLHCLDGRYGPYGRCCKKSSKREPATSSVVVVDRNTVHWSLPLKCRRGLPGKQPRPVKFLSSRYSAPPR